MLRSISIVKLSWAYIKISQGSILGIQANPPLSQRGAIYICITKYVKTFMRGENIIYGSWTIALCKYHQRSIEVA